MHLSVALGAPRAAGGRSRLSSRAGSGIPNSVAAVAIGQEAAVMANMLGFGFHGIATSIFFQVWSGSNKSMRLEILSVRSPRSFS